MINAGPSMKFKASQSTLLRLRCDLLVNSRGEIFSQKLTPFFLNVKAALTRIRMAKAISAHPRMHNASDTLVLYQRKHTAICTRVKTAGDGR